jgi:hypothetical protein
MPTAAERAFLVNFVTLLVTPVGATKPYDAMADLVGMVIDEMYRSFSDEFKPSPYSTGIDVMLDSILEEVGFIKDSKSSLSPLFQKMSVDTVVSLGDNIRLSVSRTSDWANTFAIINPNSTFGKKTKVKPIQCIVRPQESPEDLIKSFDLGISSVAIYRGEFIVHENLFKSLENKELLTNTESVYKNKSLASRVFQALRHFKYHSKLNFDFSKELYQDVLNVMSDANQLWVEAQKAEIIDKYGSFGRLANQPNYMRGVVNTRAHVSGKVKITTSQNYEQEVDVKETLTGMIKTLADKFPEMQKMKHWDISHALFLQDSPIIPVKSILEKSLANQHAKKNYAPAATQTTQDYNGIFDGLLDQI